MPEDEKPTRSIPDPIPTPEPDQPVQKPIVETKDLANSAEAPMVLHEAVAGDGENTTNNTGPEVPMDEQ